MGGSVFVEPGELRAAVTEVAAATGALERARGALESAGTQIDIAEVGTFVRQWRSEFELIAEMLDAYRDVLVEAAQCYEDLDGDLAECFR